MFRITDSSAKYLIEVTKAFRDELFAGQAPAAVERTATVPEPEILEAFARLLSMSPSTA
jgi:hypothetical protein